MVIYHRCVTLKFFYNKKLGNNAFTLFPSILNGDPYGN